MEEVRIEMGSMKHVLQKKLEEGWGRGLPGTVIIRAWILSRGWART